MTCCRDWEIVLDEDAQADYAAAPEPLHSFIADKLYEDEEGDVCFRLTPDGRCALLDSGGLCTIQRSWGEEHLCVHCAAYPRFIEEYGCLTERCEAVSCPEAARLLEREGIFPLLETDDGVPDAPFPGVDGVLLAGLIASRGAAFAMLRAPDIPIWGRLAAVLRYAAALQSQLDRGAPLTAPPPAPAPSAEPWPAALQGLACRLFALLAALEPLDPKWPELLRRQGARLAVMSTPDYLTLVRHGAARWPGWEEAMTHLAEYFVFRHWPKAVNDDALYGRAALGCAACVILFHLDLLTLPDGPDEPWRRSLLWARMSREVEHLDENFFALADALSFLDAWPLAGILSGEAV